MSIKTIFMPEEIGKKWLEALRSGEYEQAREALEKKNHVSGNCSYCCLGVLQKVVSNEITPVDDDELPHWGWLNAYGIKFMSRMGNSSMNPYLYEINKTAAEFNDSGANFDEIADVLERAMEFTDK